MKYIDKFGNIVEINLLCKKVNIIIKELKNKYKSTYMQSSIDLDFYTEETLFSDLSQFWKSTPEKIMKYITQKENNVISKYLQFFIEKYDKISLIFKREEKDIERRNEMIKKQQEVLSHL